MNMRAVGGSVVGVSLLAGLWAFGVHGTTPAPLPHVHTLRSATLAASCPAGHVPLPQAEAEVPALKDLPDGGTITVIGWNSRHYDPCSWTIHFNAQPPMSLLVRLLTVAPGYGYTEGGEPSPARSTPIKYVLVQPGSFNQVPSNTPST